MHMAIPTSNNNVTPSVKDPYFQNVELLLHMNGVDGGSVFTDSSKYNRVPTLIDSPQTRTTDYKFPTSSFFSDNGTKSSGSCFWYEANQNLVFGLNDFTIEFFVKTSATLNLVMSQGPGARQLSISIENNGQIHLDVNTYTQKPLTFGKVNDNVWHHVAVTRKGTVFYGFVDGKLLQSTSNYGGTVFSQDYMLIGAFDKDVVTERYGFVGWLDEFRVTNGVCRYISDFVVPTEPFPDS